MILTIDLVDQDHILFPMIDYVGVHVKINSLLVGLPIVKYHYLGAFALQPWPLILQVKVTHLVPHGWLCWCACKKVLPCSNAEI